MWKVNGSSPLCGSGFVYAFVAQLAERCFRKAEVASSRLVESSGSGFIF